MNILDKLVKELLWKVGGFIESKGQLQFGRCTISYNITQRYTNVEVHNHIKDTYLDRIAEYLESVINEREIPECSDWEINGFRDEADYLRYKFG